LTLLAVVAGFLLFMALIRGVHALDDYALGRYGYAPFAMPNLLFMLVPHGLLLLAIQGTEPRELWAGLAGAGLLAMLLVVGARTNGWIALIAAPVALAAASVLAFSVFFRNLVQSGGPE
jgi:hypothetical protein